MPDIKHQFTGGKMNKDLDDRLVPNGEYRDAMNVQVSTSDTSNMGVIQNILGNSEISDQNFLPEEPICIGTVSDEKTNAIYWFVCSKRRYNKQKSIILEYKDGVVTPVLVSYGDVRVTRHDYASDDEPLLIDPDTFLTNGSSNIIIHNEAGGMDISPEMLVACYNQQGEDLFLNLDITTAYLQYTGPYWTNWKLNKDIPGSLFPGNDTSIIDYMTFSPKGEVSSLSFNSESQITAINIIDDLLFWTDGYNEPKKINITRCKQGTNIDGNQQTILLNYNNEYGTSNSSTSTPLNVKHTTVIRNRPIVPLRVVPKTSRSDDKDYNGIFQISSNLNQGSSSLQTSPYYDFSTLSKGDIFTVRVDTNIAGDTNFTLDFWLGDVVNIQEFNGTSIPPLPLLTSRSRISCVILPQIGNSRVYSSYVADGIYCDIRLQILSISGTPPVAPANGILKYVIDKKMETEYIFEDKFIRFGYRYKYLDGEYSGFSPFSVPAFSPGQYNYSSTDGYNLSMTNTAEYISLTGFISENMPEDVAAIEIIHKDDYSPGVYLTEFIERPLNILPYPNFNDIYDDITLDSVEFAFDKLIWDGNGVGQTIQHENIPNLKDGETYTYSFLIEDYSQGEVRVDLIDSDGYYMIGSRSISGNGRHSLTFKIEPTYSFIPFPGATNTFLITDLSTNQSTFIGSISDIILTRGDSKWINDEITITSSGNAGILPSNQILRGSDDVPLTALAQEVIGNRIIYANYTSGFDIKYLDGRSYLPEFEVTQNTSSIVGVGSSVKSLRDYQVGLTYSDNYNRESAVFSHASGGVRFDQTTAQHKNKINVAFTVTEKPIDTEYFKFYVKETEGEYYNLLLDRYYETDNDDYWLSIQSSDRNKLDEDSFIILKKGVNDYGAVSDKNKYKVLDISNEAPSAVRRQKVKLGEEINLTNQLFSSAINLPLKGSKQFQMNYDYLSGTAMGNLHDIDDGILYIEFTNTSTGSTTERYEINSIHCDWDGAGGLMGSTVNSRYNVTLRKSLGAELDDILASNLVDIDSTVTVSVYNYVEKGRPEFDGRFFVRIAGDDIFNQSVKIDQGDDVDYDVVASRKIYLLNQTCIPPTTGAYAGNGGLATGIPGNSSQGSNTNFIDAFELPANSLSNLVQQHYPDPLPQGATINDIFSGEWLAFYSTQNIFASEFTSPPFSRFKNFYQAWFQEFSFEDLDNDNKIDYDTEQSGWKMYDNNGEFLNSPETSYWFFDCARYFSSNNSNNLLSDPYNTAVDAHTAKGKTNLSSLVNGKTILDIGFGGIHSKNFNFNYGNKEYDFISDFFNLNVNPNHIAEASFANNFMPGAKFRWREDPLQKIHTIQPGLTVSQRVRYATGYGNISLGNVAEYEKLPDGALDEPWKWGNHQAGGYTNPANFSKNFMFSTQDPHYAHWSPIAGGAILGSNTIIQGAEEITLTANTSGTNHNWQYTNDKDLLALHIPSITGTSAVTGNAAKITVGMILHKIGTTNVPGQWLVVKQIQEVGGVAGNIVRFGGYDNYIVPLDYSLDPTSGQDLVFTQATCNGFSPTAASNYLTQIGLPNQTQLKAVGYTLEFLKESDPQAGDVYSPAVFETEPKPITDVNLYYEVGQSIPHQLTEITSKDVFYLGQKGTIRNIPFTIINWEAPNRITVKRDESIFGGITLFGTSSVGDIINLELKDGTILKTDITAKTYFGSFGQTSQGFFHINKNLYKASFDLPWFNCWSYGNGVESNRIKDTFNQPFLSNGVKVNTEVNNNYTKQYKKHGLIFSGIYNSTSDVNNLNQFITAEGITKDLNPGYGSIQKLYARDSDLIALCEDKVLKILANKDALYNADSSVNLTASNKVLGQSMPFSGDYGISKNPESFAAEAFRVYFTDKQRGKVLRLSQDGLTPISDHGMEGWFNENLKLGNKIIGSFDTNKEDYNLTIKGDTIAKTISFNERVRGWVSFKSFYPEYGISVAGDYYTILEGKIWKHDDNELRNTFYGEENFTPTSLKVIIGDSPGSVKSFSTINYEGSQSKVNAMVDYNTMYGVDLMSPVITGTFLESNYYNLDPKTGWYVNNIKTDIESGSVDEFINKEGKWFNYIRGENVGVNDVNIITSGFDTSSFDVQGIGSITNQPAIGSVYGCTDDGSFNYNASAVVDDGTCIPFIYGCMDLTQTNYDPLVNTDDGSCYLAGCIDCGTFIDDGITYNNTLNCNPLATVSDGSCINTILGCTDSSQFIGTYMTSVDATPDNSVDNTITIQQNYNSFYNYSSTANTDDGSCIASILGCTNSLASNFIPIVNDTAVDVNTDNGTCEIPFFACTIFGTQNNVYPCNYWWLMSNGNGGVNMNDGIPAGYNQIADDGSCVYCDDPTALNYDGATTAQCDEINAYPGVNNVGMNGGACNYWGSGFLTLTLPYQTPTSLGLMALCHNCFGAGETAPDYYEIEWQGVAPGSGWGGGIWDPNQSTMGTGTYTPAIAQGLPPYNQDDFWVTGLVACTYYNIRIRGVNDTSVGGTFYTDWFAASRNTSCAGPGCTDNTGASNPLGSWGACNYDSWASSDDSSCYYDACSGCTDSNYLEFCDTCWHAYGEVAVTDGSGGPWLGSDPAACITLGIYGCMDPTMFNYDSSATIQQTSSVDSTDPCIAIAYGCTDGPLHSTGTNYHFPSYGNTTLAGNLLANNYDSTANTMDTSCDYGDCTGFIGTPQIRINASGMSVIADWSHVSKHSLYTITITAPDGITTHTTSYQPYNSQDGFGNNCHPGYGNWMWAQSCENSYNGVAGHWEASELAEHLAAFGTQVAGDYTWTLDSVGMLNGADAYTCGPITGTQYYSQGGCTDPIASNYNASLYAITDDGSCVYEGCMDTTMSYRNIYTTSSNFTWNPGWPAVGNILGYAANNFAPNAINPCNGDNSCCEFNSPSIHVVPHYGALGQGNHKIMVQYNFLEAPNFATGNWKVGNMIFIKGGQSNGYPQFRDLYEPDPIDDYNVTDNYLFFSGISNQINSSNLQSGVFNKEWVITADLKHTADPSGTLYPVSITIPNGSYFGCTDPYANNYDASANIYHPEYPSLQTGGTGAQTHGCTYNAGCSNVQALNYDPAVTYGNPADCVYAYPVNHNGVTITQEGYHVQGDDIEKIIFDFPELHTLSGYSPYSKEVYPDKPLFRIYWKEFDMPIASWGPTQFVDLQAHEGQYVAFPGNNTLGCWEDASSGNDYSGKAFLSKDWFSQDMRYPNWGGIEENRELEFYIVGTVDYAKTNMIPGGVDANGTLAASPTSGWTHYGGGFGDSLAAHAPYDPNDPLGKVGGPIQTAWGKDKHYPLEIFSGGMVPGHLPFDHISYTTD